MSDRLALANAIEDAGIERGKAARIASVIFDAIHDNVATKADLVELKHDLTMRGLAAMVTGLGALFAALHYWPPHG
jgi:hypothetical protein